MLKRSADGRQAFRDIQGATLQWIEDKTFSNIARNERGEPVVSASQIRSAFDQIEKGGKLEVLFGPRGASKLKDFKEQVIELFTRPPRTMNTSQTAGVIKDYIRDYFPKIGRLSQNIGKLNADLGNRRYIKETLK